MLGDSPLCYLFLYVDELTKSRLYYEQTLGFVPIEEDAAAVKYDAGNVILALNRASDFSLSPAGPRIPSLIVFHTDDLDRATESLGADGVKLGAVERYDIGAIVEVPDPDGHQLMLYEPSAEALTWPSAVKIKSLLGGGTAAAPPAEAAFRLGRQKLIYVFLFVRDFDEAAQFYRDTLGLRVLEIDTGDEGVIKYDVGGAILATHVMASLGAAGAPRLPKSPMACVFLVENIADAAAELKAKLSDVGEIRSGSIGKTVEFRDPTGHSFYLYEPSPEALSWASGDKLRALATTV